MSSEDLEELAQSNQNDTGDVWQKLASLDLRMNSLAEEMEQIARDVDLLRAEREKEEEMNRKYNLICDTLATIQLNFERKWYEKSDCNPPNVFKWIGRDREAVDQILGAGYSQNLNQLRDLLWYFPSEHYSNRSGSVLSMIEFIEILKERYPKEADLIERLAELIYSEEMSEFRIL